jgi:hypothetical protein
MFFYIFLQLAMGTYILQRSTIANPEVPSYIVAIVLNNAFAKINDSFAKLILTIGEQLRFSSSTAPNTSFAPHQMVQTVRWMEHRQIHQGSVMISRVKYELESLNRLLDGLPSNPSHLQCILNSCITFGRVWCK